MSKLKDINVLSLFSGAGGLDIGFHNSGFNVVACVEIEKMFCKTLELNKTIGKYIPSDCHILNEDITLFDPEKITANSIDFVIGGPPCQTYSAAGRRIGGAPGLDDERGRLFEHYCRILNHLNPKGFLFENVRGLLGVNNGEAWQAVVAAFSNLGYNLFHAVLDSAAYGVPQHRERIFLVGLKTGQTFLFPRPLFGPDSFQNSPYITAGESIKDFQDDREPYHEYDGKYGYLLSDIPEGMNYSFYTAELGHPTPVFAWRSKFSSFLYKIAQDKPVKTIQAQLGKFAGPFHWKNRRLTINELKRLQSFPDDYEFAGSYIQVAQQVGNSVPPKLATYLAQALMKQVFDSTSYPELELMQQDFKQTFDARKGEIASKTRRLTKKTKTETIGQLSLWEQNSITRPVIINSKNRVLHYDENFAYSYINPVKKLKLSLEDIDNLIENSYFSKSKGEKIFRINIYKDTTFDKELKIEVRNVDTAQLSSPCWKLLVHFDNPLLDGISDIELILYADNPEYIYVGWDVIEEVIKNRSAYISLVGLYGHFAEPHPRFTFSLINLATTKYELASLLSYYSQLKNCSRNIDAQIIARDTEIEDVKIPFLMRQLRNIRYDIRSNKTNSRIPEGYYFCAYPFPELGVSYQINKTV